MEETENPANSGDSDTTTDEPTEDDGDNTGDDLGDNETPDIENPDENQDEEQPDEEVTNPDETEIPEETDVPDKSGTPDDEEANDKTVLNDSTINALIPSDLTITAVEPDTSENAAAGATKTLASAVITYTNGCVRDGKMRKDADITFKLDPIAGKKLGDVQFKTKGTGDNAVESAAKAVTQDGDTYKIEKSDLMHEVTAADGTKTKVNDVSVTIIVNTTDVKYTLKAAGDSSSDHKLYLMKTENNETTADTTKEITAAGLADKISYAEKTEDISFTVKANDSVTSKIRKVSVAAGDNEEKVLTSTGKTAAADGANPIYTFKPSDLDGVAQNDNQDIVIKVEASNAATISIATKSDPASAVTFGAVENAAELYTGANAFVTAGGDSAAASAAEGQKVIFTAAIADTTKYAALTADDVTATFTPTGGEAESIDVTAVNAQTINEKAVPAHYVIDLADVTGNGALAITATTTLDDTKDAVKTADFTSVSENSIVINKSGATENLAGKSEKTDAATYAFSAAGKPGYEIYQVEAVYNKVYKGQGEGGADLETISGYKENLFVAEDTLLKDGEFVAQTGNLNSLTLKFTGQDADGTAADQGHAGKTWTAKSVKVNVYAKMTAFTDDKTVRFTSTSENPYFYEVTTGDTVVADENDDDVYTVKSGADFFTFTVEAVTKPLVTAKNGSESIIGEPEKTESGYKYQIAASALEDSQTIDITRDAFDIEVSYNKANVSAEVFAAGKQEAETPDPDSSDDAKDAYIGVADTSYKFIISAENDTTKISKVSYKVGDAEEQTVTAKGGNYVFSTDVTGNVVVTVETADEYDLVVKENDEVVTPDKNKVYNVGHASTVTAQLLKGEEAKSLFNADVKDGNAVAATIARITGDVVTLEFDSTEYNKVLTVELTLNDKERTKQSFKVKTTAAAAEVSLAGVKNGKVDIPVDTQAKYKLTVKTKNASTDGLKAKVVPADDAKKADAAAIEAAKAAVDAKIEDGNLVITAKPAKTGAADAAKVIIVDESNLTAEQKAALTVDNALKGSVVTVTTKDATIVGKNPTVKLVAATDKTIKVQLGVPKEVVDPIVGKIYYKVELTVPQNPTFPEGVTDAQKAAITAALTKAATDWNTEANGNLYQSKATLDSKGGLLEIPVMKFENAAAGLDKGALLSGFSVKATLLQTTTADGLPSAAATTIEGGNATLENLATKNPYYEVKLGLKKGTTNLITGQNKDVVVATPNFNKLTSYSTVKVEFVNTSTGEVIGTVNGNENQYYGLTAEYNDLSNAVVVNAAGASYYNNANDYYKNLGVKVTAYAEDSAYGAVATQKLTVVNGIEYIGPTAPLEIYKADKKAATFTVATDLNDVSENKKYAPKTKKLDYKIVSASYDPETDSEEEMYDGLPAAIKTNVTVKNGKVTINKNYIPAPKAEQNQFKVLVTAMDYANSDVKECTDIVTITDEGLTLGTIAVFEELGGSWKLVAVNDGSIEATQKAGEYQVAILKPGVKTTKKFYDLDEGSEDIIDPDLVTFKSSNAKSVAVDPESGELTILKAAKNVSITVTPKDGSKPAKNTNVLKLKNVGQVSSASPLLRISRYDTSALGSSSMLHEGGATTIPYHGNSTNNYFKLDVVKAVPRDGGTDYESFYLANYSISYKGAKQVKKTVGYYGDSIIIVANAADAVITLKDKANRNAAAVVYTLHNNDFVADKNAKAPKITTKTKMTQNTWANLVEYTVKGGKNDDFTDKYVMLSIDQTKKNPTDIASVFTKTGNSYLDKPLPILLGENFNLYVNTWCKSGNYNLVATVGSLENGVFKPEYKDAKVAVKIAKEKAASLSATGNYTLSMKNQSGAYIKYKSGNDWAEYTGTDWDDDWNENGINTRNYAKNAIINGQENHFRDYFEAKYDNNNRMYITLKNELPLTAPDNNPTAPALDKITDDANKNDRIGYISINNGVKFIDVKLTITLKDYTKDKTKYKVTATPVLDGPKAVTALTILEGKTPVDVSAIMAVSTANFAPVYDRYGNCYLEAANLPAGSHKVDLYIVPWNAPKAYRDAIAAASGDAAKREAYEKYGIKTSITVKAADKTTAKGKVALVNKGSNKWTVADTDYNAPTSWSKYTPFSFKSKLSVAETTDITIKATVNSKDVDYVTFDLADKKYMSYENISLEGGGSQKCIVLPTSYPMTIKLDKAKLAAAIAADAANADIAERNKLNWGKTLNVKATFSYGTNGPKEDELTFQIKLPGNAGAADAAVTEALTAAEKKLQSDIETKTKQLVDRNSYYTDEDGNLNQIVISRINEAVESYIRNEVNKAIQGAAVNVDITNDGTTVESEGADPTYSIATWWNVKVTAVGAAQGAEPLYDHKFVIPDSANANGVISAINNLNLGSADGSDTTIKDAENEVLLKVTADTTAAEFAAAVRAKLGVTATRNISITASIVGETKKPSVTEDGEITFKLTVRDLYGASNSSQSTGEIKYVLKKLDNLAACKDKVTDGLTAAVLSTIVKDAWKNTHTTEDALKAEVKTKVLAKANELINNNPAITVDGFAKDADGTTDLFSLTKPADAATAGSISFTLHLKDTETAETEANAADFKLEVSATTVQASEEFQSPAELLNAAKAITEIDYVADQAAAITAIKAKVVALSKNPGYNTADIVVEATANTAETGQQSNGTVFTLPGENNGSITKVVIKTGTGDGLSATVDSITIKKQTTPAPAPEG